MSNDFRVFLFLKFGEREHLLDLMNKGMLHMGTLKQYSTIEDPVSSLRCDQYEGADFLYQPDKVSLMINNVEIKKIVAPFTLTFDNSRLANCFCLFSMKAEKNKHYTEEDWISHLRVDKRNFLFGDSCLIIREPPTFLKRFKTACQQANFAYKYGFVEYVDLQQHHGQYGPFRKPLNFSYQSEYRLLIENVVDGPRDFIIGDLSDISEIVPSNEVNDLISFRFEAEDGSTQIHKLS